MRYTYLSDGTKVSALSTDSAFRYRYAGKEEQRFGAFDSQLLDFGARYYDPWSCQWTAVDPMAEKSISLGPFTYCSGTPLTNADVTGMFDIKQVSWQKVQEGSGKIISGLALSIAGVSICTNPVSYIAAGIGSSAIVAGTGDIALGIIDITEGLVGGNRSDDIPDSMTGIMMSPLDINKEDNDFSFSRLGDQIETISSFGISPHLAPGSFGKAIIKTSTMISIGHEVSSLQEYAKKQYGEYPKSSPQEDTKFPTDNTRVVHHEVEK